MLRHWSPNSSVSADKGEDASVVGFTGGTTLSDNAASVPSIGHPATISKGNDGSNNSVRLFGLTPLNHDNAAKPWEVEVLREFEANDQLKEWSALKGVGEEQAFRYVAPLIVNRSCLDCHSEQNYRLGHIAGGISIDFIPAQVLMAEKDQQYHIVWVHIAVWVLLCAMTLFGLSRHRRQLLQLQDIMLHQDTLVEARTKQLQQEVLQREEAQERQNRFIESSGEGILVVDLKGCCTLVNSSVLNMLGYDSSAQVIGRNVAAFLCPNEDGCEGKSTGRPCDGCLVLQALKSPDALYDDDHHFLKADASSFPIAMNAAPIQIEGRTMGLVISFCDITERKAKEVELRKLSRAVEFSPATTMITDADGKIEYVNRRFCESSGYTSQEVLGKKTSIMRSGKTPNDVYESLWRHISAGMIWQGEVLNRKKCGKLFWEDISISPINDDAGKITHFVAVKEDIS